MNILKELRNLASKNYTTWKQVDSHLQTLPDDPKNSFAGHVFQALSVEILKQIESADIKAIYNLDLDNVSHKLLSQYGIKKGDDKGVDLLLESNNNIAYGVQSKYRSKAKVLHFGELSTFTAHQRLPGHIIISNVINVGDMIKVQTKNLKLYLLDSLVGLSKDDWEAINSKILGNTTVKAYKPSYKPHQVKAVNNTVKMLKDEDRCQIIHPCGTGKTYVMAHLVATMEPKLTIVAVPSLALEKQTKDVLVKQLSNTPSFGKFLYGVVGSDDTVDKDNGDALTTEMGLCGLGVTTNYRDIATWIKQAKSEKSKLIIFTTYQSIDSVEKAVKKTAAKVGLVIADEAHKTATHKKSTYTRIHSSKLLPAAKRVYMTATPRVFSKDPAVQDVVYDMSDVKIFGKQSDYLSFKEAIDQKLLTDYQMVAVSVNNEEVMKYALERKYVNVDGTIADMEQIIGAIALHKARKKYKINHTISYHTSNKNAEKFSALYSTLFKNEAECFVVNGSMNAGARIDQLQDFEEAKSALVSNAKCLQEGVSMNAVDSILFGDPKSSAVDIIQSAGRPMRLHPGKELGTIIVPVFHEKEEDLEGAIESGSWKDVVSVLRALGSADERVQEWMMNVKSGNGERSGSGERNGLIVERMPIAFLDFDKKYIDNVGLSVIGKSKTVWTREMVEKLLKEKKFKSISEWIKFSPGSYDYARKQGIRVG
jgi:predicted helicase